MDKKDEQVTEVTKADADAQKKVETQEVFDKKYVHELREENKSYRLKADELEKRLKGEEDAKLEQQNKYKELADNRLKEIDMLKSKSAQVDELSAATSKLLKAQAEGLDETIVDAVITNSNYTLDQKIEKIAALKKASTQKVTPPDEPASNAGYASPDELFIAIEKDIRRQSELSITNRTLFDKFIAWKQNR